MNANDKSAPRQQYRPRAVRLQTIARDIFWPGQGVAPGPASTGLFQVRGGDEQ